jgi:hypothetical protein
VSRLGRKVGAKLAEKEAGAAADKLLQSIGEKYGSGGGREALELLAKEGNKEERQAAERLLGDIYNATLRYGGRVAKEGEVEKYAGIMERKGVKVIYLDEAQGADLVFAKRALEAPTGKLRGGALGQIETGEWAVVLPGKSRTSAAALFEEDVHASQLMRGVLGAEAEVVGPSGQTLKLIGKEASELDVAIQMHKAVKGKNALVAQADLNAKIKYLAQEDLQRLNLTEDQVRDIVTRYGQQSGPFLTKP